MSGNGEERWVETAGARPATWGLVTGWFAGWWNQPVYYDYGTTVYYDDGNVYYGDTIPAKYAERPKEVVNEHGVTLAEIEGKKTEEQKEAERIEMARQAAVEQQRIADQALLATYLSVEEILLHRDRRIELFKAQSKVTEMYLRGLEKRLDDLRTEASSFSPYSDDPDAPMINDELAADLKKTRDTIERHQANLEKFQNDEREIMERFDGDISRFKRLKGIED